jgi:tripartite-type tricarboxylate transporter receptor subunit TctC
MTLLRGILLLCVLLPGLAAAQAYPQRAVRVIVPGATGDASDITARAVAHALSERLGQPFVVENRAGAGGIVGSEAAAKAAPDGYTLIVGHTASHGINAAVYPKLPYDPLADFTPISLLARAPNLFVVHPGLPARTVREFIALAKQRPGQINFASGGNGTSAHLSAELLKSMAGINIVHVPYKGATPAVNDLVAGQVQVFIGNMPPTLPHVGTGKLRALAVTSAKRWPDLPEVPTMAEAGLPGYETVAWFAMFGPRGLPAEIARVLSTETVAAVKSADVSGRLTKLGMEAVGSTPDELSQFMAVDIARWKKVAAESGTKVD